MVIEPQAQNEKEPKKEKERAKEMVKKLKRELKRQEKLSSQEKEKIAKIMEKKWKEFLSDREHFKKRKIKAKEKEKEKRKKMLPDDGFGY
jgi:hypothetical protein